MSQDKAASLTSSLFARKGRASPASLLIADLETGEAPGATEVPAVDLHGTHNGAPLKRSALELNRQPGRKGSKAPEGELPLLAFVEAQVAADRDPGGEAVDKDQIGEAVDKDQIGEAADKDQGGAPETDFGEPSPAASLLERSGAGLRRANGRVLDGTAAVVEQEVAMTVAAEAVPEAATADPEAATALAEETVSGDANVTAIEDAPAEEAETLELESAVAEEVAPDVEAEAEAAPTPDGKEKLAASSEDTPIPPPESRVTGDAALSATLALRQASAQGGAAAPQNTIRRTPPPVAPSRRTGGSVLWRSAAVVALGAALGLGAYAYLAPGSVPEAPQEAGAPIVEALPEGSAAPEAEQPISSGPTSLAEAEVAPEPESAPPQEAAAALAEPSFDIIRIEPDGQSIIAGRAHPLSEWILLNNGTPIASVKADINGEWVVLPGASLVPGANAFSLVPKTERGKVAIPAPAEEPEALAPAEPDAPSGPRADAAAPGEPVALPQAKPQPAPRDTLSMFRTTPEGGYEVQLASVRQSADAERERQRLTRAYPGLLGELDLRVQEAAVDGAGTFYRVRSGGLADLGAAREVCRRLEGEGQGCLVVKRVAAAQAGDGADGAEPEPESPPPQQAERPE